MLQWKTFLDCSKLSRCINKIDFKQKLIGCPVYKQLPITVKLKGLPPALHRQQTLTILFDFLGDTPPFIYQYFVFNCFYPLDGMFLSFRFSGCVDPILLLQYSYRLLLIPIGNTRRSFIIRLTFPAASVMLSV